METIVRKWGNSLGVRIPKYIIKELSLKDGASVDIDDKEGQIIIIPRHKRDLGELLKKISKTNIHSEVEIDSPIGKELW